MTKKGFTLLELLVVIAIIGLLSTLAVIALGSAREKARDSKRLTDIRDVRSGLELYYLENNAYPVSDVVVQLGTGGFACLNADGFNQPNCSDPFLTQIPLDPNGAAYQYVSNDGTTYSIQATLEGEINGYSGTLLISPAGITSS